MDGLINQPKFKPVCQLVVPYPEVSVPWLHLHTVCAMAQKLGAAARF